MYCIVFYPTVLYFIIFYCVVSYFIVLYHIIFYCIREASQMCLKQVGMQREMERTFSCMECAWSRMRGMMEWS